VGVAGAETDEENPINKQRASLGGWAGPLGSLWLVILLAAWQAGSAQEACIKRVFNRYCLGGDINAQLVQQPLPLFQQPDGELLAAVYQEGRERVYVMGFRGRIYKVVRQYQSATQLKFDDLYKTLRDKYGSGEDRSRFPGYARSPASKLGAIRRGDGRAVHFWDLAEQGFHVELNWNREMGLTLSYYASALAEQVSQVLEQGL